jgi:hypothetical protein
VSSADVPLNVATAARPFHASDGTGFADLIIDGHRETCPLRSKRFQAWLRQQYYERTWDAPNSAALNAALNVLEAQAQFDGPQHKVSVRLAEHDLPRSGRRISGVASKSAPTEGESPRTPRFRRSAGMQLHLRDGSIEALTPFLNLASENDLCSSWHGY